MNRNEAGSSGMVDQRGLGRAMGQRLAALYASGVKPHVVACFESSKLNRSLKAMRSA